MTPLRDDLPADAVRVLAGAIRSETVCHEFRTVWHCWGAGRTLVLLHGGSGSWTHWIRNVEALSAGGWRVCVPDLPGFGDSQAAPAATDAPDLVDPVAHGILAMSGGEACPVVGFSFGALTAVLAAAAHPGVLARLVLVGTPALGLRDKKIALTPWLGLDDPEKQRQAHRRNLQTLMLHDPACIDDFTVAIHAANLVRDRMRHRKVALTDVVARTLHGLIIPVDAIFGQEDVLYAGRMDEVEAALRHAPSFGQMVRIPGAGHWVQYEAPTHFNSSLLRLLACSP
jgi:2-hydroxy-6-oxonona-2,4-dienedioate hydrolase